MTNDPSPIARSHPELPATAPLADRILYRIKGPGTNDFLQGQMSQNLAEVTTEHSPRAAASTPKGRAYLLTRLVRDGDDVLLTMPTAIANDVANQLNKYLMLFRGTSMERLEPGRIVGILGKQGATRLLDDSAELPAESGDTQRLSSGYLIRSQDTAEGTARFELWLPEGADATLQAKLDALPKATEPEWNASEISAGVADLVADTREAWVPQMLNWQHLGGIHFKKGCYTGQEVIARMHFLGQLKKSTYRLQAPAGEAPAPGTHIIADGKSVGEVVRAIALDDGTVQLLAVLKHAAAGGELSLEQTGQPLVILPLPYAVPERE